MDSGGYFMMYGQTPTGVTQLRRTFICYVINSKLNQGKQPKITSLRPASNVVLMVEKRMRPKEVPVTDAFVLKDLGQQLKADWQRFTGRHKKGGNILFADGHVAFFTNNQITHILRTRRHEMTGIGRTRWCGIHSARQTDCDRAAANDGNLGEENRLVGHFASLYRN